MLTLQRYIVQCIVAEAGFRKPPRFSPLESNMRLKTENESAGKVDKLSASGRR